jgi:hypothetical protein
MFSNFRLELPISYWKYIKSASCDVVLLWKYHHDTLMRSSFWSSINILNKNSRATYGQEFNRSKKNRSHGPHYYGMYRVGAGHEISKRKCVEVLRQMSNKWISHEFRPISRESFRGKVTSSFSQAPILYFKHRNQSRSVVTRVAYSPKLGSFLQIRNPAKALSFFSDGLSSIEHAHKLHWDKVIVRTEQAPAKRWHHSWQAVSHSADMDHKLLQLLMIWELSVVILLIEVVLIMDYCNTDCNDCEASLSSYQIQCEKHIVY